jgi:hypothetical protein
MCALCLCKYGHANETVLISFICSVFQRSTKVDIELVIIKLQEVHYRMILDNTALVICRHLSDMTVFKKNYSKLQNRQSH